MQTLFKQLRQPFPTDKLSFRPGATFGSDGDKKGIALAYIDARDVMQRLDDVVGPENWKCRYPFAGCCELSIRIKRELPDDGREGYQGDSYEWITKANCADESDVEGVKGQASDSFKRAAVLWGIGQYLYDSPNKWYQMEKKGKSYVFTKIATQEIMKDLGTFAIEYFIDRDVLDEVSGQIHAAIMSGEEDVARATFNDLTEVEQSIMWRGGKYFTQETKVLLRASSE